MARSLLLWVVVVVVSLALRAWMHPVYVGQLDDTKPLPTLPLAQPFGDDLKGSSDAFLSLQARSILANGLDRTGGFPLFNQGRAETRDFAWYDHHPPGVALATALAFELFGESELVARSVALLFSTLTLVVVVALVRKELGGIAALVTAAGALASPMGSYWATHLDYPVPTLAACTVFLACALRVPLRPRDGFVAAAALALALSFDFLALFAVAALVVERLIAGPRSWRQLLGWPLFAGVVGIGLLAWQHWATSRYGHPLGGTLKEHVEEVWELPPGVESADWWKAIGWNVWEVAGPMPLLALVAGLISVLVRERAPAPIERLFRASLVLALLAGLVPRMRAYDHPYFQLYLQLPIALAFALTVGKWLTPQGIDAPQRADGPAVINGVVAAVVILAAGLFFTVWNRSAAPAADVPSAYRLGNQLAPGPGRPVASDVAVVVLPPASQFNEFTPIWYARRLVLRLEPGRETREDLAPRLAPLGLADAPIVLAKGARWPGSEGYEPLKSR